MTDASSAAGATASRRGLVAGAVALTAAAGLAATPARGAAPPTTFVVAHGAWSAGWSWKKMHPLLAAKGHALHTPTYTGLGERAHLATPQVNLDTHITDVVNHLFYEDLHDVVLIAHSYGGIVGTGVADRARDRIRTLIYLDAFVPEDGQALVDLTGQGEAIREAAIDGWLVAPNPVPADTSEDDKAWIMARRGNQPVETLTQKLKLTQGPLTLPRRYIRCTQTFVPYYEKAKAAGWPVYELASTHSPAVTAPEALADLLEKIVS